MVPQSQTIPRYGMTITTVDPTQGMIKGVMKGDATERSILVADVPNGFRWPQVGESWMVIQKNGTWYLEGYFPDQTVLARIQTMNPGDLVLIAPTGRVCVKGSEDGSTDFCFDMSSFATGGGPDLGDYTLVNAKTDFSLWNATAGVVGDAVTDDTAAIQAAINYCAQNGGGEVLLPTGQPGGTYSVTSETGSQILQHAACAYRITNTIFVRPGVILKGQGQMATQILADFSATNNWDAVQVGEIGNGFSYGQCGIRDLSILSGIGGFGGINQATNFAGLVTGKDSILIENVVIGRALTTNTSNGAQVKNPVIHWGSNFDTGAMLDMSTDGSLTVRNLVAVGINQGFWLGALSGSLGCPATFDDCGASSLNGASVRIWWAQGVEFNNLAVSSGTTDILIDAPDSGGPNPNKIRGSFVQGLTIRNINSYSFSNAAVQIVPYADVPGGCAIQDILIDGYQSDGYDNSSPLIVVAKRDATGTNDIALVSSDNFQAIWLKHFWVNGSGPVAHFGACQGIWLEDNTWVDPIFGGLNGTGVTIGQYANHVTVKGNKFVAYYPGAATSAGALQYGVGITNGADRYIITENDFDPKVVTTPINDLGTTIHKVVTNNI